MNENLRKNETEVLNEAVQIEFEKPETFSIIRETLSRIGIASNKDKKLYQSCHILHKKGKYYIVHFKQLFRLDGRAADMSKDDYNRLYLVANLLKTWGLFKIVSTVPVHEDVFVKIVPFKERANWTFVCKYTIGNGDKTKTT